MSPPFTTGVLDPSRVGGINESAAFSSVGTLYRVLVSMVDGLSTLGVLAIILRGLTVKNNGYYNYAYYTYINN